MTNTLIDFRIELIDNQKKLIDITQHNITIIADLTNEKKLIESALKEKNGKNRLFSINNKRIKGCKKKTKNKSLQVIKNVLLFKKIS